jgi:hypothetical protein
MQAIVLEIVAKEWQVYTAAKMFAGKYLKCGNDYATCFNVDILYCHSIGIGTGMTQSGLTVYIAEIAYVNDVKVSILRLS